MFSRLRSQRQMTTPDHPDNLNDNTYIWHYLADKHEIEHDAIDCVADQLARLIEMCPSPQRLRDRIDEWAAERQDTPATRTQVELVRKVADAMESGEL
jgi:hypothetical protein